MRDVMGHTRHLGLAVFGQRADQILSAGRFSLDREKPMSGGPSVWSRNAHVGRLHIHTGRSHHPTLLAAVGLLWSF